MQSQENIGFQSWRAVDKRVRHLSFIFMRAVVSSPERLIHVVKICFVNSLGVTATPGMDWISELAGSAYG
jgi:hypothetical protein